MIETTLLPGPDAGLMHRLPAHGMSPVAREHPQAFTAPGTARAEGVDPDTFAKVVAIRTDDGATWLAVVEAEDHVDLRKACTVLGRGEVRLLTEPELSALAPDCEVGAMPAVGKLYDVPVVADVAIREASAISFNAGSHRWTVRVGRERWEHADGVLYADIASGEEMRPAWARS